MERRTRVSNIRINAKPERLMETTHEMVELPKRKTGMFHRFWDADRLLKDFALVGSLALVVLAVRNSTLPQAQSVFQSLQEASTMKWDESLGKLSFVSSWLPEEVREVWNAIDSVEIASPVKGEVVHAWSIQEPYLLIDSATDTVYASGNGEIMSVAHGINEERIIRIRHSDRKETVYGNLAECYVDVGDTVYTGDAIGKLMNDRKLAFEVRYNGRSVQADFYDE